MSKVSISEAARLAGKSRSYFYEKYINNGTISVETTHEGKRVIDTSELLRVFGELSVENSKEIRSGHVTPDIKDSLFSALQAENEALRQYLRSKEEEVMWLREQVAKTTALLTHQKVESDKPKKWWWPF